MKKIKFVALSIIFLIVLVIILPRILDLFTNDIDSIDDSDLSLQVISVLDEDNAYFDLIKIEDVLYQPEGKRKEIIDMVDNKMWDEKLAEEIIFNNQKAFEYFSEAAHKPKFQNPLFANPKNIKINTIPPSLISFRIMSEYSSIKALYLSKQRKDKEAMEEALNSVYIAQKIQGSQLVLIEYLVAMLMKERGLEVIQTIVATADLNNNELKKYALELDQFYKNEYGLINVIKGSYFYNSMIIDGMVNRDTEILRFIGWETGYDYPKNNYHFRPNKTKALFAEDAKSEINNINKYCNNLQLVENQITISPLFIKNYLTENMQGEAIFYTRRGSGLFFLFTKKCNEDLLVSATQTIIAIKAYKNDSGDYPDSLEQLVPDYLESIPLDYFDGNSLRYSKKDRILYSIGEDGKDEDGSAGEDWKKMPDPTFKINF